MKYCSICGNKNTFSFIEGRNRYHCEKCLTIHYQNPKPTATIICLKKNKILLARRAFEPAIGEWGLPGGFMELGETLEEAARRELKEETNLDGEVIGMIGTCSHYGTIFGDILSIAVEMKVSNFSKIKAGDDAQDLSFFEFENLPMIPFHCHNKFIQEYLSKRR
ncbi:NUDIX hydrolase [bacterium]|nr:NUDIX hydrolase [bacterium]|tara:strand:+ start:11109 stop:11600 length:492 start_codon:yes stop_codon:yes gene_type:complete